MEKRDYFILFFIVVLAAALRFWGMTGSAVDWFDVNNNLALNFPNSFANFAGALATNSYGFLYYFCAKFGNTNIVNIILGIVSVISMFFVGLEFAGNKKGKNTAIFCALLTAIAPLLIYFSGTEGTTMYSLAFFLTSFVILFSLRIFNTKNKKRTAKNHLNWVFLAIFDILLILVHNMGLIFVLIALIALYIFKDKKSVAEGNFQKLLGGLILLLPAILFVMVKALKSAFFINHHIAIPLSQQIAPISGARVFFSFSDLFSFHIVSATGASILPTISSLIHNKITLGIGFIAFVIVPAAIALICILKNFLTPKKADFYLLVTAISTFFTVLIVSCVANFSFLSKYIVEIYPILILLFSSGVTAFKSKTSRIILITLFCILNIFYLVNLNTIARKLVEIAGNFFS